MFNESSGHVFGLLRSCGLISTPGTPRPRGLSREGRLCPRLRRALPFPALIGTLTTSSVARFSAPFAYPIPLAICCTITYANAKPLQIRSFATGAAARLLRIISPARRSPGTRHAFSPRAHRRALRCSGARWPRPEDDFYGPPQSREYFESLLDALDIAPPAAEASRESNQAGSATPAKLIEFQRKGYYLSYLSECPIPDEYGDPAAAISALGPALIRRIRFNYKPKHIALLGSNMAPLIGILEKSGMGPLLLLDRGQPLTVPEAGDLPARAGFRTGLRTALPLAQHPKIAFRIMIEFS